MMIPSEMPSVTMGENGHGNGEAATTIMFLHGLDDMADGVPITILLPGHFKSDAGNVFQHAEQMMR